MLMCQMYKCKMPMPKSIVTMTSFKEALIIQSIRTSFPISSLNHELLLPLHLIKTQGSRRNIRKMSMLIKMIIVVAWYASLLTLGKRYV